MKSMINFIRMKKFNASSPYPGVISAASIDAYKPYGEKGDKTEVILRNGHSFVSNETVAAFEERLYHAIKPYIVE
jgi:hypothetical protein